MRLSYRTLALCALLAANSAAFAGTGITGTGPTPELACWDYNYKANAEADKDNSCYASCKLDKVVRAGSGYSYRASVPNHEGSCRAPKYDRKHPVDSQTFLERYPRPGSQASTPQPKPDAAPKYGIASVNWLKEVPDADHSQLIIENRTKERSVTWYSVKVRDSRYSAPARVIEEGNVILEPGKRWEKEFHQWGGTEWAAVWR